MHTPEIFNGTEGTEGNCVFEKLYERYPSYEEKRAKG